MRQINLICLAALCAITNANAGNEGAPEYWTGTYLGAHFGAGAGTINQSFTDQSVTTTLYAPSTTYITSSTGSGRREGDITGSNLDLFVGYNFHQHDSKFVFGGQFEGTLFNNTTMKTSGTKTAITQSIQKSGSTITSNIITNGTSVSEMSTDLQSMVSLIGRAGFLAKPNTLLYALVGATEGDFVSIDTSSSSGPAGAAATTGTGNKRNQWQLGLTAGGGLEYKLNDHWSLLGEYRYLHFNFNYNGGLVSNSVGINQLTSALSSSTDSSSGQNTRSNVNFNLGQIGIVYRI